MKLFRNIFTIILATSLCLTLSAEEFVRMNCKRLPDMAVPRADHAAMLVDGHLVVAGGHTTGFIPVTVAERLKSGRWQTIPALYTHDAPFSVALPDGKAVIGGGYAENLGVGRTYEVECLDPSDMIFAPLPCLDSRRARSSAARLPDGRTVVSGNWYADDSIEISDGKETAYIKDAALGRSNPYILVTGPEDAIIFGSIGIRGEVLDSIVIDRLNGPPYSVPLLKEWKPLYRYFKDIRSEEFRIGDGWTYLIPGQNCNGQTAALLVDEGVFSILPLQKPIPSEGPFGPIEWMTGFFADRTIRTGWMWGVYGSRAYLLRLDYGSALDGGLAGWNVYYTDEIELPGNCTVTFVPGGHFYVTGGMEPDNYNPSAVAWELTPLKDGSCTMLWLKITGIVLLLATLALCFLLKRRNRRSGEEESAPAEDKMEKLYEQVQTLMEEHGLFLEKGLGVQNIASMLGSNVKYVSQCINKFAGCSFKDYINAYRIRHAQKLMKADPQRRLADIAEEAGFASEVSFFRNFKLHTGLTPARWLSGENHCPTHAK